MIHDNGWNSGRRRCSAGAGLLPGIGFVGTVQVLTKLT
jgi:hypothetical protein